MLSNPFPVGRPIFTGRNLHRSHRPKQTRVYQGKKNDFACGSPKLFLKCTSSLRIFQRGLLQTSGIEFYDVVGRLNPFFRIRKSSLLSWEGTKGQDVVMRARYLFELPRSMNLLLAVMEAGCSHNPQHLDDGNKYNGPSILIAQGVFQIKRSYT